MRMNGAGASPSNNSLYYINCYKPPVLITIKAGRQKESMQRASSISHLKKHSAERYMQVIALHGMVDENKVCK
jgi:hypothetical protein